jgi:hypothetical protein
VRPEGLGEFKNQLIGYRTGDLPACNIVPWPLRYLHAPAAYCLIKSPLYPFDSRLCGPQNRSRLSWKEKVFYHTRTRTPTPRPSSPQPIAIPTELPQISYIPYDVQTALKSDFNFIVPREKFIYFMVGNIDKLIFSGKKKGLLRSRGRGRKWEWSSFLIAYSKLILSSIRNYAVEWPYMDKTSRKEVVSSQWESTIFQGGSPRKECVSVSSS